jgi:hypothetical protein
MLCKKCKTAVNPKDIVCGFCGAKINRRKKLDFCLSAAATFVIVAACGGYFYWEHAVELNKDIPVPVSTEEVGNENFDVISENDKTPPDSADKYEEQWIELSAIERALSDYLYSHELSNSFITNEGYFYNQTSRSFITIQDLINSGHLSEKYSKSQALLMFLRPGDFNSFKEADFGISPDLTVFCALNEADGVLVCGGGTQGLLYRENFISVLSHYKRTDVYDIFSDDSAFDEINSAIVMHENIRGGAVETIYTRSIKTDGNFAVVIASFDSSPQLKQYLISLDKYDIILDKLENGDVYEKINNALPTFNFDLAGELDLSKYTFYNESRYEYVLNRLISQEVLSESTRPFFVSGTDEYIYIESADDKILVGFLVSGSESWSFNNRNGYPNRTAAREAILDKATDAPWFISLSD